MPKPRVLVLCLCIALGCSNIKSNIDYDPNIDFSKLKTYAWLPNQPQGQTRLLHTNFLRLNRIRDAIDRALLAKGLNQTKQSDADFLIRSLVTEKLDSVAMPTGHSPDHDPDLPAPVPKTKSAERYENVALIVDFLSARDQNLIWRGEDEIRVQRDTTAKTREGFIQELVGRILSHYPPAIVR